MFETKVGAPPRASLIDLVEWAEDHGAYLSSIMAEDGKALVVYRADQESKLHGLLTARFPGVSYEMYDVY